MLPVYKISLPDYKTCMNSYSNFLFHFQHVFVIIHVSTSMILTLRHYMCIHSYVVKSSVNNISTLGNRNGKTNLRFGLLRNVHTSIMVPNQTTVTQNRISWVIINWICAPSTKVAGVSSYSSNNSFQCQLCIVCEVLSTGREAHIFIQAVKALVDMCSNCSWLTEYQ